MVPKPDSGEDDDSLDMQKVPLREADDDPEALVILGVKFNLNIQSWLYKIKYFYSCHF